MAYKYLLIDNDNTLMDFNAAEKAALRDTLVTSGLPADEETCAVYHRINDALWKALERGETTQKELKVERFRQLLEVLQRTEPTAQELCDAYQVQLSHHAELLPGAMELMEALHGKVKIALVSNGVSFIQRGRLSRCPFTPMLDAVIISEEVGVSKPDPALLFAGMEALSCTDVREAVMMGDSLSADIAAAVNAGMDSIFYDRKGVGSDKATHVIRELGDAVGIILG